MECIEAKALKSSFLSQMASSQVFYNEDVLRFAGINSGPADDFPVEELLNLDFSDKDFHEGSFLQESEEDDEEEKATQQGKEDSLSAFSGSEEFDGFPAGELSVPDEDLENLEWLSQIVDDSNSGLSLLYPAGSLAGKPVGFTGFPGNRPAAQQNPEPCFPLPVPVKTRSKRSRSSGRSWSLASPSLSTTTTESSPASSSSYASSNLSPFVFMNQAMDMDWFASVEKPAGKKQKRKPAADTGLGRKCTHCQVQKTPQWRTGPLGPKTLCNACGVRYKSGRLFPEYRPACSPTFSQDIHSNSHRKVLEMRRKKDFEGLTQLDSTHLIPSC